jgi:hypothetical protein
MRTLSRRALKQILAAALSPLLVAAQLLSALPAAAQVEVVPRATVGVPVSAPVAAPAALGAPLTTLPAASLPSAAPASFGVQAAAPEAVSAQAAPVAAAAAPAQAAPQILSVRAQAAPRAAAASPKTLTGRLARAARALPSALSRLFDGSGETAAAFSRAAISRPRTAPDLRPGVLLDAKPRPPKEGSVSVSDFHLSKDHELDGVGKPVVLDADPSDPASVERALRGLVDSDPAKYGATGDQMAKVHVQFVPGDKSQGQADTYYAVFRQWMKGTDRDGSPYYLLVDGGSLTFVVKVFDDGKPTVMATEGRLYPGVTAGIMTPRYSDAQLQKIAERRLLSPADTPSARLRRTLSRLWTRLARAAGRTPEKAPVLLTREITNVQGTWRAVNVYQATDLRGRPVIVAVDVNDGTAFAWSAQDFLRGGEAPSVPSSGVDGVVTARGTSLTPDGGDHGATAPLPLPFASVYDASGRKVATTDADGNFSVPGAGSAPVDLTVRLEGRYAAVSDEDGAKNGPVTGSVRARPGRAARLVLNPSGDGLELDAAVNGYVYTTRQIAWLGETAKMDDERLHAPLAGGVKVNRHDMPGNAYYSPADDSLNLQADAVVKVRGKNGPVPLHFENTAQPSIIYHEITHRAVQVLSQISLSAEQAASAAFRFVQRVMEPVMDGGVNEAIADTVSMFMRNSPRIGEGFIIDPPPGAPSLIRTGENTTQFDPSNPDPHAQGEAYMGFTWTVRRGLIQALGEAAGAAYAALLVVPTTLYSQPKDVPTAMLHVLLADMTRDGSIPHADMIRAAAQDHGPVLPAAASLKRP